jgi:hypothetical protein
MDYQRPTTAVCAHCGKAFRVGPNGRVPKFCKPGGRTSASDKAKRGDRPSAEERQRRLLWGVLQDAGLIPVDKPLPVRKAESGQ